MIFISMTEKVLVDKALLNIKEFCDYLGIGQTKARELQSGRKETEIFSG